MVHLKKIDASVSYGKKTGDGIVLSSSTEKIKTIRDPIDLLSTDKFFYDVSKNQFFYEKKKIEATEILKILDKLHQKTTKWWEVVLIFKLIWFHIVLSKLYKKLFSLVSFIQFIVSGTRRSIHQDLTNPRYSLGLSYHDINKKPRKPPINFYGYEVEVWLVISYSFVHLIIFFIFFLLEYEPLLIRTMFSNSFITFMYAVFTVGIANELLPDILKSSERVDSWLGSIQKKYYEAGFRKVKIQTSLREWVILVSFSTIIFWLIWTYLNGLFIRFFSRSRPVEFVKLK